MTAPATEAADMGASFYSVPPPEVVARDHASVQTKAFTTLLFSQLLHALSIRAGGSSLGSVGRASRPWPLMLGALVGSTLLHLALVYSGFGNTFFRTVRLEGLAGGECRGHCPIDDRSPDPYQGRIPREAGYRNSPTFGRRVSDRVAVS